jgi:hypothetical protein
VIRVAGAAVERRATATEVGVDASTSVLVEPVDGLLQSSSIDPASAGQQVEGLAS